MPCRARTLCPYASAFLFVSRRARAYQNQLLFISTFGGLTAYQCFTSAVLWNLFSPSCGLALRSCDGTRRLVECCGSQTLPANIRVHARCEEPSEILDGETLRRNRDRRRPQRPCERGVSRARGKESSRP